MTPYIEVSFRGCEPDESLESAIHRWVARLEEQLAAHQTRVTIERSGRRRTMVSAVIALLDGTVRTAAAVREDPYVAVADTFRTIHQRDRAPTQRSQYAA